jgi:hypothetical protein
MGILSFLIRGRGRLHPGDRCPRSGQYTYSRASPDGKHKQRTCVKDEVMPPPPPGLDGGYWSLTDATRH